MFLITYLAALTLVAAAVPLHENPVHIRGVQQDSFTLDKDLEIGVRPEEQQRFLVDGLEIVDCPSEESRLWNEEIYLDLKVNVEDLTGGDFDQLENDCRDQYNNYILENCPENAYFRVTSCFASLLFDETIISQGGNVTSNDRLVLSLEGFAYSVDPTARPFALASATNPMLPSDSEDVDIEIDMSFLDSEEGCVCYNTTTGTGSLPTAQDFAVLLNSSGIVHSALEVGVQLETCGSRNVFEETIQVEFSGVSNEGPFLMEKTIQDVLNDLSVQSCVQSHLFVFNVQMEGMEEGSTLANFKVEYIAYQDEAPLFDITSVFDDAPSFRRRLSDFAEESIPIPSAQSAAASNEMHRKLEDEDVDEIPMVAENPCFCALGVVPIPILPLMAINFRLGQSIANGAVPGINAAQIVPDLGSPVLYEKIECDAPDETFSTFFSVDFSGSIETLGEDDLEAIAFYLEVAYTNATIKACDQPFFRSITGRPNVVFGQNESFTDDAFLLFELVMSSRGLPDPPTALKIELPVQDGPLQPVRALEDDLQLEAEFCPLQAVIFGPTIEDCQIGQDVTEADCRCERDGCYCPPDAETTGPATASDVVSELNSILNMIGENNADDRRLLKNETFVGKQRRELLNAGAAELGLINGQEIILDDLGLAVQLQELTEQNCSGLDFKEFQVILVVYINVDPILLTAEQRQTIADSTVEIINDFNFNQCEQTFTRVSSARVLASNVTQPARQRELFDFGSSSVSYPFPLGLVGQSSEFTFGGSFRRRNLEELNLVESNTPFQRNGLGQRSLLNIGDPDLDDFRCFCRAGATDSGEPITLNIYLTLLNQELEEGLLGNETNVTASNAATVAQVQCPDNSTGFVEKTASVMTQLEVPFSQLTDEDIQQLATECVNAYNFLSTQICDPDFDTVLTCTVEEYKGDVIGDSGSLIADQNRQVVMTLIGESLNEESSLFGPSSGRRSLHKWEKLTSEELTQYPLPMRLMNRGLQGGENICIQPTQCVQEDGRLLQTGEKVTFTDYISVLSESAIVAGGQEVDSRDCEDGIISTYSFEVEIVGVLEDTRFLDALYLDTLNRLSVEECDARFIFGLDAVFTPSETRNLLGVGTRKDQGVTIGETVITYVCYGGPAACDGSIFGSRMGRLMQSVQEQLPFQMHSVSSKQVDSSLRTRKLQPSDVQGFCLCDTTVEGTGVIAVETFNEEIRKAVEEGALGDGVLGVVATDTEMCRCEMPGEGVYPPPPKESKKIETKKKEKAGYDTKRGYKKLAKAEKSSKSPSSKSSKAAPSPPPTYAPIDDDGFIRIDGIKILPYGTSPCTCEELGLAVEDNLRSKSSKTGSGKKDLCLEDKSSKKDSKSGKKGSPSPTAAPTSLDLFTCPVR